MIGRIVEETLENNFSQFFIMTFSETVVSYQVAFRTEHVVSGQVVSVRTCGFRVGSFSQNRWFQSRQFQSLQVVSGQVVSVRTCGFRAGSFIQNRWFQSRQFQSEHVVSEQVVSVQNRWFQSTCLSGEVELVAKICIFDSTLDSQIYGFQCLARYPASQIWYPIGYQIHIKVG